jgi:hypothetical protein
MGDDAFDSNNVCRINVFFFEKIIEIASPICFLFIGLFYYFPNKPLP